MNGILASIISWLAVVALCVALYWYFVSKQGRETAANIHSVLHDEPRVTCPVCHRRGQVQRVTGTSRVTSAAAGGLLFSRKARARYYCPTDRHYW